VSFLGFAAENRLWQVDGGGFALEMGFSITKLTFFRQEITLNRRYIHPLQRFTVIEQRYRETLQRYTAIEQRCKEVHFRDNGT
jgi:hypothetical protein